MNRWVIALFMLIGCSSDTSVPPQTSLDEKEGALTYPCYVRPTKDGAWIVCGETHAKILHGSPGDPGPTGPEGPEGPEGQMGPAGTEGLQGPSGPEGEIGPMGPAGFALTLVDANNEYIGYLLQNDLSPVGFSTTSTVFNKTLSLFFWVKTDPEPYGIKITGRNIPQLYFVSSDCSGVPLQDIHYVPGILKWYLLTSPIGFYRVKQNSIPTNYQTLSVLGFSTQCTNPEGYCCTDNKGAASTMYYNIEFLNLDFTGPFSLTSN